MSADNFLYARKDGKVEERYLSDPPNTPGRVIFEGPSQEAAIDWAFEECFNPTHYIEYGVEVEE